MHLLWDGHPVPASVAAWGDLLAQWSGWAPVQSCARPLPADGLLLNWGPDAPAPRADLPSLWIARHPLPLWHDAKDSRRPNHLRPAKEVRPTDVVLAHPLDDAGPHVPLLREGETSPLPRGIVLARSSEGLPVVVGLQGRAGRQPVVYVGADIAGLMLRALGAEREHVLAMAGHPVAGLFSRTGEPEHMVKFPWVNHALGAIRWCCDWLARESGIPRVSIGRYPEGKTWALGLSHDVDVARRTPTHVLKQVRHAGRRAALALAGGSPTRAGRAVVEGLRVSARSDFWAIDECVAADEALGVRSSFYFYSNSHNGNNLISSIYDPDYNLNHPRVRASVAAVVDHGFEVGLHGSYGSHLTPDLLRMEREGLEACLGQPVAGVRQHFLQGEAPQVWRTQLAAGLAYDTSWSYRDRVGFRSGCALPYRVWDVEEERSLPLWELPLVLMDGQLFDRECATEEEARQVLDGMLDQLRLSGGAGSADWHQRFFDDPAHPWRLAYERLVARARDGDAWLGPCGALIDWWRSRAGLRWSARAEGGTWNWRLEAEESLAHLTVSLAGVEPATVEPAGDAVSDVEVEDGFTVLYVREVGPGQPVEFRARAKGR